jgi:hypothetical protein
MSAVTETAPPEGARQDERPHHGRRLRAHALHDGFIPT